MPNIFLMSIVTMSSAFFREAALAIANARVFDFITYPFFLIMPNHFTILYISVPQTVHLPFIACLLFFMVTFWVSFISCFALHFTQYPVSAINITSLNENLPNYTL